VQVRSIIRRREVRRRTGLSDTTTWRLERVDRFPKRIRLTEAGAVGWYEDEIDRWVHDRVRSGGKRPPRATRNAPVYRSREAGE
jgi:predicted DNA-binding transcriptional regulator AlpA